MNSSGERRVSGLRPETAYSICAGSCVLSQRARLTGRKCWSQALIHDDFDAEIDVGEGW